MNRSIVIQIAFVLELLLAFPRTAHTAVFARDWKTPGDGLLTYDDVNRREWLDLTETRLAQFPGVNFGERYQNLLPQLDTGGLFEGFFVAGSADLAAFATSAGVSPELEAANVAATRNLIGLVGISFQEPETNFAQSYGLLAESGGTGNGAFRVAGILSVSRGGSRAGVITNPLSMSVTPEPPIGIPSNTGVWLFRVVPEPSSRMLVLLMMLGIEVAHRRMRSNG